MRGKGREKEGKRERQGNRWREGENTTIYIIII